MTHTTETQTSAPRVVRTGAGNTQTRPRATPAGYKGVVCRVIEAIWVAFLIALFFAIVSGLVWIVVRDTVFYYNDCVTATAELVAGPKCAIPANRRIDTLCVYSPYAFCAGGAVGHLFSSLCMWLAYVALILITGPVTLWHLYVAYS